MFAKIINGMSQICIKKKETIGVNVMQVFFIFIIIFPWFSLFRFIQ